MLKEVSKVLLSLALLAGFVGATQAAEMSREEFAIKVRKGGYSMLAWYFGPLGRMAKGEMPYDQALFQRNAETVAFLSKLPKDAFIPNSDLGETKAKPEIWSKADKFKAANEALETEAAKLVEMSKAGKLDALKEQVGKVQKTCKACHEDFKAKSE